MKQYILVRQDLKMPKGKLAGQVAHASIGVAQLLPEHKIVTWIEKYDQRKIILKVKSKNELMKYVDKCEENELKAYLVQNITNDKWKDEYTCLGIGPYNEEKIGNTFQDLRLL